MPITLALSLQPAKFLTFNSLQQGPSPASNSARLPTFLPSCSSKPSARTHGHDGIEKFESLPSSHFFPPFAALQSDVALVTTSNCLSGALNGDGRKSAAAAVTMADDMKSAGIATSRELLSGAGAAVGLGIVACALLWPEGSWAAEAEAGFESVMTFAGAEPSNALSLPTWIIHVASVAEWVTAMALVWEYGNRKGRSAWKGLTWGMVPLLGGALCACTYHFFYNAESLEVLVGLQSFLTLVGNFTMWGAAFRIWKLSQEKVTID